MSSNGNIDIELLAGLDINSSEQEIRNAIKIIQSKIRSGDSASIQIDAKLDDRLINNTLNKLQSILKTKEISIDTRNSIIQLQKEANAMMGVVTSANKAAKEKLEFTNANKKVEKSARDTANAIRREADVMGSLNDIDEILERINAQGRQGNNVFRQYNRTLRDAFMAYSAFHFIQDSIYKVGDSGREAVETVESLNKAAMDLRMATGGSFESAKQLVQNYNTLGKEIGALTREISDSADAWLRQGKSVSETNELIKASMMLSKIANVEAASSTEYLTSIINAYDLAVEEVVDVVSKLTAVDMESASEAGGLAVSLSKCASAASIAGVEMDRLIGYIATVKEVTMGSDEEVGNMFKSIFSRMNQVKAGKFIDLETGEALNNVEAVVNSIGIATRDANNEMISTAKILDEVGKHWKDYDSVTQRALATAIAGTYQYNRFASLMQHYDDALKYTDVARTSKGTSEEKFGYYLESLQAKTNALKASLENLAATTISDELYGSILDTTKSLVDATAASGLLKGTLAGLATAGSIYVFQHLVGYATDAAQSFSNLNEAMNMVNSNTAASINLNRLVDLTQGLSQSQTRLVLSTTNLNDAQKLAVLRAQGLSRAEALLQLQTWGVTSAQQGATAATITFGSAMRGLYMTLAANPLFVVATAVTLGVTLWNKYKESVEDAAQTAEKAREHYQSLADELSTLNNELKTTQDRMAELEAIGTDSLSLVEQEEYDKLCKTNEELERELRIKEALAKVAARESAEASENALTDESYTSNTQTNRDGSSKKVDNITYVEELVDRATRQKELLEEAKAELLSFENNWTGDDVSMVQNDEWQYLNDVVTNAEKAIGETETAISEAYEIMDEDASGLVDTFGNVVDGFEDTYNRVEDVRNKVDGYFNEEPKTTTKDALEKQFGKVRVSSLSDEDLEIAYNLQNIGDMTFDDLKDTIKDAKEEAKESINIKVNTSDYLSNLETLSDGFEKVASIYNDVKDMGDFDFSSLTNTDFADLFSGTEEAKQAYQDFIDVVSSSPSDINACQSAFDNLVSEWFYAKTPLKDITEETYDLTVAWLKQKGVANAVEVADNALAQSKARAWLATKDLTNMTAEEISKFAEENATIGVTKDMLYQLQIQMIQVNQQGLDFSQQISALKNLAINAGIAASAMDAANQGLGGRKAARAAERSGMSTVDYIASQLNQKIANATTKVNYTGGVGSGSSGGSSSSGSSSSSKHIAEVDKYKNLTDAVDEYDRKLQQLERTYDNTDSVEERIGLKKAEIKLYKEQKDAIDALNKARDEEISGLVNKLRGVGFQIDYDPKTENLLIKNREHINDLNQSIIEQYEEYIERVDELNDANKDSADQWDELTSSIVKAGKELKDLEQEKFEDYIEGAEHLLRLMENRKDAFGKESSVYTDMMNATLKRWKDLVTTDYEGNIEEIREREEAWMDFYDARIEKEKEILEMQLDDNDRVLDGVIKVIDDQIKALDDQIDGLSKANDERKKALELQKAQAELDKARNQKTRHVLRKDVGWVWEADDDAIKEAEENLSDLEYESKVDALEDEKEALEDLKEKWEEIPNIAEDEQNRLLMIEKLGADAEEDILNDRIDVYEDFKDDYIDIQEQIQDKTDELEEHTSAAYLNVVKAFENMAKLAGIGLDTGVTTQTTQSSWYVNKDGTAPSQAKKGDIIYTKGGTYEITGKDENGKFTSKKLDNVSTPIIDGMWGTKISEKVIESGEDVVDSVEDIIRVNEDIVDKTKKQILTDANLQKYIDENSKYTSDEIIALMDNEEVMDMLSDYTDDNSDATEDNTDALYRFIDALANLELEVPLEEMTLENFDDSVMDETDQAYIKELQRAWNLAMGQGNIELANQIHAMADEARMRYLDDDPNNDYNAIAESFSKLEDSKYEYSYSTQIGGKNGDSEATQKYLDNISWLRGKADWSDEFIDRLDNVVDAIENGNGLTATVYEDQYGRTSTVIDYTDKKTPNTNKTSGNKTQGQKNTETHVKEQSDRDKIADAQKKYNEAKAKGDKQGMADAHAEAEAVRNKYGYSGGDDGSQHIVTSNKKSAKSTDENTRATDDNTDSNYEASDSNKDVVDSNKELASSNKTLAESNEKLAKSNSSSGSSSGGSSSGKKGSSGSGSGSSGSSSSSSGRVTWSHNDNGNGTYTHSTTLPNGKKVSYTNTSKKAKGGSNLAGGVYNVNEKGDEIVLDKPDEGNWIRINTGGTVIPHEAAENMWEFGANPKMFLSDVLGYDAMKMNQQIIYTGSGEKVIQYNIGTINPNLPNVTKPDEFWDEFTRNLPNDAEQWGTNKLNWI